MKKILILALTVFALSTVNVYAQKLTTKDAYIYFNPNKDQTKKDYEAATKQGTAVLNTATGEVALLVAVKTFRFNNALLEEHFNENYLHTTKFPNAKYSGKLSGYEASMLDKDGTYNLTSSGQVTLHGVTKPFSGKVTMAVEGKSVTFTSNFGIKGEDFDIEIPGIVKPKLAETTPVMAKIKFTK
jgi:polyisoprenoid-binding protein YceI